MDEQECGALEARQGVERLDLLAATGRERGFCLQKKRNVRAKVRGDPLQFRSRQGVAEQFIEAGEGCRGVAAAAAEPGGQGNVFFEMDLRALPNPGCLEKRGCGPMNEVSRVGREAGQVAGQFDAAGVAVESEDVEHRDRMHDGFEFVVSVGAFAQDVEQKVDLAAGLSFKRHNRNANPETDRGWRAAKPSDAGSGHAENLEAAAGYEGHDFAPAETHVSIRGRHRVRHEAGSKAVGIGGPGRKMIGEDGSVGREGGGHHFVDADAVLARVRLMPRTTPVV